jgi:hypothetical protein
MKILGNFSIMKGKDFKKLTDDGNNEVREISLQLFAKIYQLFGENFMKSLLGEINPIQ